MTAHKPRRANRWAERTVAELANVAREMATQEHWARQNGLLQRRDARAKWLSLFALLIASALARHWFSLALLLSLTPGLGYASRIPAGLLLRRAATLLIPFAFASLVFALVNPLFGTPQAIRLFLRAACSVSLTLLLVLTTRWRDLMRGLGSLGVPALFVAVLESAHRHLFLLPVTASEMFQARRARTVGTPPSGEARRFVGFSIGALLGKTHALAETTHDAMRARGYVLSAARMQTPAPFRLPDAALCVVALVLGSLLVVGDRALG